MDAQTQTEARHWENRADLAIQTSGLESVVLRYVSIAPKMITPGSWTPSKKRRHPRRKNTVVHAVEVGSGHLDSHKATQEQGCGFDIPLPTQVKGVPAMVKVAPAKPTSGS